jgi:hypothetical protein
MVLYLGGAIPLGPTVQPDPTDKLGTGTMVSLDKLH